jgi:hypothetical protein
MMIEPNSMNFILLAAFLAACYILLSWRLSIYAFDLRLKMLSYSDVLLEDVGVDARVKSEIQSTNRHYQHALAAWGLAALIIPAFIAFLIDPKRNIDSSDGIPAHMEAEYDGFVSAFIWSSVLRSPMATLLVLVQLSFVMTMIVIFVATTKSTKNYIEKLNSLSIKFDTMSAVSIFRLSRRA